MIRPTVRHILAFAVVAATTGSILRAQPVELIVRVEPGGTAAASLAKANVGADTSAALPWAGVRSVRQTLLVQAGLSKQQDAIEAYTITVDEAAVRDVVAAWESTPGVRYVQRNHRYQLDTWSQQMPNEGTADPYADSLGHHGVVNVSDAWSITRGTPDVRVGFVDTGVDFNHPDLANAFWINAGEDVNGNQLFDIADLNGLDDDGNGFVDDIRGYDFVDRPQSIEAEDYVGRDADATDDGSGHGTIVAGVLGARADNGIGIAGLAPGVSLLPLRAFGADGRGDDDDIAAAIVYAADNGVDVVNLSFGDSYYSPLLHEAVRYAVNRGTVVVASSGNLGGDDPHYPSDYPEVISTVWLNETGEAVSGRATYGTGVDIGAPGSSVFTTRQSFDAEPLPESTALYGRESGSSLASPMVSAAAALIRSVAPELTVASVRNAIVGSATDIGEAGWDHRTGAGLLNIGAAIRRALPSRIAIEHPDTDSGSQRDHVTITGTVLHPALRSYAVDFAAGHVDLNESDFEPIVGPKTGQIQSDTLAIWNTVALEDGPYTIRLRASLQTGQSIEDRRRVFLDRTAPQLQIVLAEPALVSGRAAFLIEITANELVTAEIRTGSPDAQSVLVVSDRVARRHGLIVEEHHLVTNNMSGGGAAGEDREVFVHVTNRAGLESTVPVPVRFPRIRRNDALFERTSLPLRHGFALPFLTDFDADGLAEVVFNSYKDGQLGDTVRIAEYPTWHDEGFILSNVFPRDAGDTNGDGKAEILGQVAGATILFESVQAGSIPNSVSFVDTTGLGNPTAADAVWGARLADTDGDGVGEIVSHNTSAFRILERSSVGFEETARLENPTGSSNSELSENALAQPEVLIRDLDGDGLTDILFGDTDGDWVIYEATENNTYELRWLHETDRYNAGRQFASGRRAQGGPLWFASSTTNWVGQRLDREYEFDATVFSVFGALADNEYGVLWTFAIPGEIDAHSTLSSLDVDGNGSDELVVVAAPDVYIIRLEGESPEVVYYSGDPENPGGRAGYRSAKVIVGDVDNDSREDLIVATAGGKFELWRATTTPVNAPPVWVSSLALNASTVVLNWTAFGSDSVSVLSGSVGGTLDTDTVVVSAASVRIVRTEQREYGLIAWYNGDASPLSQGRVVRPHAPATLADVEIVSKRQLRLRFTGELASPGPKSGIYLKGVANPLSLVPSGEFLIVGLPGATVDSLYWSGLTDAEGTPIADSTVWVDTVTGIGSSSDLVLASWAVYPPNRVVLRFSEAVTDASATNVANYSVTPFGSVSFVDAVDDNHSYSVTVSGIAVGPTGLDAYLTVSGVVSKTGKTIATEGNVVALSTEASDLASAYVFPNPAQPRHDQATIAGLPRGAEVEIFSSDGVRLRALVERDGNGGISWDLRDDRGALVPSGVYLLRVSSNGSGVLLKAAVIR